MLVPPLIIDFMSIFGINYSYASLAMGSYGLMYMIGGVISGYLSTKIGARKSVFLGALGSNSITHIFILFLPDCVAFIEGLKILEKKPEVNDANAIYIDPDTGV